MRQLTDKELYILDQIDKVERNSEEFEQLKKQLVEIENELKKQYPNIDF